MYDVGRSQRTLENQLTMNDDKITLLEQQVKSLKVATGDAERKYEEVNIPTVKLCDAHAWIGYFLKIFWVN